MIVLCIFLITERSLTLYIMESFVPKLSFVCTESERSI